MVAAFAKFEQRAHCHRVPSVRAEGRVSGRRPKLTAAQRREIAESIMSGRRTAAAMARLYA